MFTQRVCTLSLRSFLLELSSPAALLYMYTLRGINQCGSSAKAYWGGGGLLLLFQGTFAKSWNNSLCNNALLPFALWPFQTMTISLGALQMSESSAHFDCAPIRSGIKKKKISAELHRCLWGGNKAIIFAFRLQVDQYARSEDTGDTVSNMGKEFNPF